jgi:hypothetical protein
MLLLRNGGDMAKTAAERQAEYRKNRSTAGESGDGERRINTWVATGVAFALSRLARRYGVTQREMLERLILEADQQIINSLDDDSQELCDYLNVTA